MAIKEILIWPNPQLLKVSEEVTDFNIDSLVVDLHDTVKAANGLGLAAIQIGVPKRVLLMQIGNIMELLVNPRILSESEPKEVIGEGCLSLPGETFNTTRFNQVIVMWYVPKEDCFLTRAFTGLEAVEVQHEVDHLDGKLLVTRPEVGPVKRDIIRRRMLKYKKAKLRTGKG